MRLHPRALDQDLVARAIAIVCKSARWKRTFMRPPSEFRGRHSFFVEAFARPRVDKLTHLFRSVRELRVALRDQDDLRSTRLGDSRMCAI